MSQGVLSNAMKHAAQILSRMDVSVEGAIDWASSMFDTEMTYASFESNCWLGPYQEVHASQVDFEGKPHYTSVLES